MPTRYMGLSMRKIERVTNVSTTTVHHIIHQFEDGNRIEAKNSTARKLTKRTTSLLERQVKQNTIISGPKLTILCEEHYGGKVQAKTVLRAIKCRGYPSRIARRKPCLSAVNKKMS